MGHNWMEMEGPCLVYETGGESLDTIKEGLIVNLGNF